MRSKSNAPAPASKSPPAAVAPTVPAASLDDIAAYLREAPVVVGVLAIEVPSKVPARDDTFAQQDLRKLDADLRADTDRALVELAKVGPDRLADDLGPAVARLRDLDALVRRRAECAAVLARLRSLIDYAEVQQRVFDHDAVLMVEAVADAVAYLGQFDDAMRDRYAAALAVLSARAAKVAEGRVAARASAPGPTV